MDFCSLNSQYDVGFAITFKLASDEWYHFLWMFYQCSSGLDRPVELADPLRGESQTPKPGASPLFFYAQLRLESLRASATWGIKKAALSAAWVFGGS